MAKKGSSSTGKPMPTVQIDRNVRPSEAEALLQTRQGRFAGNMGRHQGLDWAAIQARLEARPDKVASLYAMEATGGAPDVVGHDPETGAFIFCDCSAQSPVGRRSICYDREAQKTREEKGVYPAGNAVDLAAAMGITLLDEEQYRALQELGEFDTTTSSWIETPGDIRQRGGAIFADRRYDHVFVYHNSAPSFYASRGFRGALRV